MESHPESYAAARPEDTQIGVRRAYERGFRPGEIVFEVGDPGEVLYVIQSGTVELSRPGPAGRRVVARLGRGSLFGEMSVLVGGPRTVRAVALTEARLLELDAGTFRAMCHERPEIALGVIERLAERVIELERRLAELGVNDVLRTVVRCLLRGAERAEVGARVRTTLRALAEEAGLSLWDAHRALQALFERKLIRLVDDVLIVPDLDALAASLDTTD